MPGILVRVHVMHCMKQRSVLTHVPAVEPRLTAMQL